MYISLYDLGLFVLFAVIVVAGIFLIVFLRQAIRVVSHIQVILNNHEDNIQKSIAMLPETLANINSLASTLRETVDQTNNAMQTLQEDLVDNLRDGLETFIIYAKVISEIFRVIFSKVA